MHLAALTAGFVLDLVFGDPHWLPHPVRWIGQLITVLERLLRRVFPCGKRGERLAGLVLAVLVIGISTAVCCLLLWACCLLSVWLAFFVETVLCYQLLATKSLRVESMKVFEALQGGTLEEARYAVSMIVGRDVCALDERGVTKAAVETVAENCSDGVIAPMLFMAVGGAPLGVFYKACNTLDSMVGYKNDKYRYFGTASARLDDILNFIPARLAGLFACLAAWFVRLDANGAWKIFVRDRKKHASPNSAHTESAFAGALGVQLAGDAVYFGVLHEKPTIGDVCRQIEISDIPRANRLMYATAVLGLVFSLIVGALVWVLLPIVVSQIGQGA